MNKIIWTIFTVSVLTYFYVKIDFISYRETTLSLMIVALLFLIFRLTKHTFHWYFNFMFNEGNTFDKKVDKPRLFTYSIFIPVMIIIIVIYWMNYFTYGNWVNVFIKCILNMLFFILFLILNLTWTKKFEVLFIPKIKEAIVKNRRVFENSFSILQLDTIFDRLVQKGFLEFMDDGERHKTRAEFSKIFISGVTPSSPLFELKMNNTQTHYLFQLISKGVKGLTQSQFLKIFSNQNKNVSEKSISASASKAQSEPKRKKEIEEIFDF